MCVCWQILYFSPPKIFSLIVYTLFRSNSLHPVGISAAGIKKWPIYPGLTLKNLMLQGGSGLHAD